MLRNFSLVVLAISAFCTQVAAQNDETISRILSCAGNIGIELDMEATNGLENILNDNSDAFEGRGEAQIRNSYLELFLPDDRVAAMQLWVRCIREYVRPNEPGIPDTEAGCIVLGTVVTHPIPLRSGLCFMPREATDVAHVRRVFRTGVEFDGGADGPFTCYSDQVCSFGWPGAPTFRVTPNSGQKYMVGG